MSLVRSTVLVTIGLAMRPLETPAVLVTCASEEGLRATPPPPAAPPPRSPARRTSAGRSCSLHRCTRRCTSRLHTPSAARAHHAETAHRSRTDRSSASTAPARWCLAAGGAVAVLGAGRAVVGALVTAQAWQPVCKAGKKAEHSSAAHAAPTHTHGPALLNTHMGGS